MRRRGLALILVVGVLAVLAVLGSAFAVLSRLERKAAVQRVEGARAALLARSGIEDAIARLALGQDPAYGGEDFDDDGALTAGIETAAEVFRPGALNRGDCPLAHALRPSFFADDHTGPGALPSLVPVDGRQRGYSGRLAGGSYALQVEDLNGRIYINGGALDAEDRDPDGPASPPECGTLTSNLVQDHRDTSMEGPNGFLVRLLDNLDWVMTGTSNLGAQVVGSRPPDGYRAVADLKPVLGAARYELFKDRLTTRAWVDPTVLKPQPMDGRPRRFEDIDDTHRKGDSAASISGQPTVSSVFGSGTEASPWQQDLASVNGIEGSKVYPVKWERNYVYSARQLRIAPPGFEPRAPVSLNTATTEVLAAVFLGLKGTYLEVWEGSAGWDSGEGWLNMNFPSAPSSNNDILNRYDYPRIETEDTPWHRTRLDYGMAYGIPGRPWYGDAGYNPTFSSPSPSLGGSVLVACAPLGRLKETAPLTPGQARALASALRARVALRPVRTWADFSAFVDALPSWEDLDGDGVLDGAPYTVDPPDARGSYPRRIYKREDLNSNGVMDNQAFPDGTPGLSFVQKDVLKAMANPNADLNDFNPDANLYKEVDKTDLCGIPSSPSSYAHTTELGLDAPGLYRLRTLGRALGREGRLVALRKMGILAGFGLHRDTAQADFMRGFSPPALPATALFTGGWTGASPYPLSGAQPLLSYPEPQTSGGAPAADALYDGQLGLGLVGTADGSFRTALFDTLTDPASGVTAAPDVRGPFQQPLVRAAGLSVGSVFPDGAYSEKDASILLDLNGVSLNSAAAGKLGFWVKPGWFPEASPRAHGLLSSAMAGTDPTYPPELGPMQCLENVNPLRNVPISPDGIFFLPARNNRETGSQVDFYHTAVFPNRPVRSLVLGHLHMAYTSECLNRRGIDLASPLPRPPGRLEGHRWQYISFAQKLNSGLWMGRLLVGARNADPDGSWVDEGGDCEGTFGAGSGQHFDGSTCHLRLGEVSGFTGMNYAADATFANLSLCFPSAGTWNLDALKRIARTGRYFKEARAAFVSPKLPSGTAPLRVTWTEVPAALWFDTTVPADDWLDLRADDQFGAGGSSGADGKRDVRIDLEVWDDLGNADPADDRLLGTYQDPADRGLVPSPQGRVYYKAVFVNDWSAFTRLNNALNVTPFLDDVTFVCLGAGGPAFLGPDEEDGA